MRRAALAVAALCGCSPEPACVEIPAACAPQYEPTWDQVWTNTVSTSCALGGCHGGGSASGGLAMGDDADAAYQALQGYVIPGDPACSVLVAHLEPAGIGDMPPGAPLTEEERCAVSTWIASGAEAR